MRRRARVVLCAAGAAWLLSAALLAQAGGAGSQSAPELPAGTGAGIATTRCLACHGAELILQQRLSRDGWGREVDKMIGWGAVVQPGEKDALIDYFAAHVGPGTPPGAAGADGERIFSARCLACHDERLVTQQRLDAAGWAREVDKMIGWGAAVTPDERSALVAFLAAGSLTGRP